MEQDEVMKGLDIALASVGFMNPVQGYVMLEAEDNGNGFEWSDGAVVQYCDRKYDYLEWTGLFADFTEPERHQAMMSRDEAIKVWQSWLDRQAEAFPVSVLHEAEHRYRKA